MATGEKERVGSGLPSLPEDVQLVLAVGGGEVQEILVRRGAIRRKGRVGWPRTSLWVVDEQQYRAAVHRLDTAWLKPEEVTDSRSGAFVDVLRSSDERFSRGAQHESIIRWQWYPREIRDTITAILDAERMLTSPSSAAI